MLLGFHCDYLPALNFLPPEPPGASRAAGPPGPPTAWFPQLRRPSVSLLGQLAGPQLPGSGPPRDVPAAVVVFEAHETSCQALKMHPPSNARVWESGPALPEGRRESPSKVKEASWVRERHAGPFRWVARNPLLVTPRLRVKTIITAVTTTLY